MNKARRALAVINPATGAVPQWRLRQVLRRAAERAGIELIFAETQYPDHAIALVREHAGDVDSVIAVGGDGTVAEVAAGAVGTDLVIGIVPTGSTNMVAKDLGIPRLLAQAVRLALTAETTMTMDVARAGDHLFIHMGGAGYDAAIMRETPRKWKRVFRWLAYVGPGISQLRQRPFSVYLRLEDHELRYSARMVLLALGGSIIHPRFVVGEGIDRTDGQLDIIVYDPPDLYCVATAFAWMALRRPARSRWHHHLRATSVSLSADESVPYELDGSYRGELPISVEMLPQGVTVRVPSVPTPGEIAAHLRKHDSFANAEFEGSSGRVAV